MFASYLYKWNHKKRFSQKMKILQIGCGAMGKPILQAIKNNYKNITVWEKDDKPDGTIFDIIIICVKPQDFKSIINDINLFSHGLTIIISIMAGISTHYLGKYLTNTKSIVRVMPNLGMAMSGGVNVIYDSVKSEISEQFISNVFVGNNMPIFVDSDSEIDNFTPVSGSGIAYFLLLAKLLRNYSIDKLGLNNEVAFDMIQSLMKNAVEMSENVSFDECIAKIASKKGVTESVINSVENKLYELLHDGLEAGKNRAVEMSTILESE